MILVQGVGQEHAPIKKPNKRKRPIANGSNTYLDSVFISSYL
jgi:hypothetical protein